MEPAERLTLITGDNGLGKTFLLDCACWALTGAWPGRPALPRDDADAESCCIRFGIRGDDGDVAPIDIAYDWVAQAWPTPAKRPTIAGLVVYARVDGSFAVWDPAQSRQSPSSENVQARFSSDEVWNGSVGAIEGMVRDWGNWQREPDSWQFRTLVRLLQKLSPPDLGELAPGRLKRIPNDRREIPTIRHSYGETPILYTSAGVKRVLALAYLMVWAWQEHRVTSAQSKTPPESRMVILLDEVESHLHPKWQRQLLPAIVDAVNVLDDDLAVQFIVTSHSPLVLASSEEIYSDDMDALLHLRLDQDAVLLGVIPYVRYGDFSRWLTSPLFDLRHARSQRAEDAIEAAKGLQLARASEVGRPDVEAVTVRLRRHLADDDPFWPRWIGFAEQFGVDI